jgi:methyl-accepting chemotaxis protein
MTRFRDWKYRTKIISVLAGLTVAVAAVGGLTMSTLSQVAIGSSSYQEIVDSKDLLADVLPPPAYLLEYQLTAYEIAAHPSADVDALAAKLERLHSEYETRAKFWQDSDPSPELQAALKASHASTDELFELAENRLVGLARAGKSAEAVNLVATEIEAAYSSHRAGVDSVVKVATAQFETADADAKDLVASRRLVLLVVLLVAVLLALASIPLLIRSTMPSVLAMSRLAEALAAGRLSHEEAELSGKDDVASAATSLQGAVKDLRGEMYTMGEHATHLASTAEELATTANMLATSDGGGAVGHVASAVHELNSSINELSRVTVEISGTAEQAVNLSQAASKNIEALGRSSQAIADVVGMISDVAEQTNLLALNATIEAARAGDAGKGFAVVAGEVKDLANQTATATQDIRRRITTIQADVAEAMTAVASVVEVVGVISDSQAAAAATIEEQSAVVAGIAREAEDAASAASQTGAAAQDVARRSVGIKELVDRFEI